MTWYFNSGNNVCAGNSKAELITQMKAWSEQHWNTKGHGPPQFCPDAKCEGNTPKAIIIKANNGDMAGHALLR